MGHLWVQSVDFVLLLSPFIVPALDRVVVSILKLLILHDQSGQSNILKIDHFEGAAQHIVQVKFPVAQEAYFAAWLRIVVHQLVEERLVFLDRLTALLNIETPGLLYAISTAWMSTELTVGYLLPIHKPRLTAEALQALVPLSRRLSQEEDRVLFIIGVLYAFDQESFGHLHEGFEVVHFAVLLPSRTSVHGFVLNVGLIESLVEIAVVK